jgi:hypothetical protein
MQPCARRWFREEYVGQGRFQKYLDGKVKDGVLPISFTQLAIAAYEGGRLVVDLGQRVSLPRHVIYGTCSCIFTQL